MTEFGVGGVLPCPGAEKYLRRAFLVGVIFRREKESLKAASMILRYIDQGQ